MTNFVKQFSGRKRDSTVWKYFEEQANIRISKCLVPAANGRICGHLVAGIHRTCVFCLWLTDSRTPQQNDKIAWDAGQTEIKC